MSSVHGCQGHPSSGAGCLPAAAPDHSAGVLPLRDEERVKQLLNGADRFITYWFTGVQRGSKAVQHDLDIWLDRDVRYR